jgi:peroxiredoxin
LELEALQEAIGEITSLGAKLVAISPQLVEFSRELVDQKHLSFDLLSDPGNKVAKIYGLVYTFPEDLKKLYLNFGIDVAKHNGDDSWTLPMPARFIIDRNSVIRYAEVDPDYTIRPEPRHTIEALKSL